MDVLILNAWSDNYMYILIDKASKICAAVDPVEPDKILEAVKQHKLKLTSVLTTHHHEDHASGNPTLASKWEEISGTAPIIYGGDKRVAGLTQTVTNGEILKIGELSVKCMSTPCHTSGHICYHVTESGHPDTGAVFTGDTLFMGGCGRFFEGTPEQMHKALVGVLAKLPPSTKVYCGHEYTVKNLQFGLTVEPDNAALKTRLSSSQELCSQGKPTVPGTIADELQTNPFMRVEEATVLSHAKTTDPIEAMRVIRAEKDKF